MRRLIPLKPELLFFKGKNTFCMFSSTQNFAKLWKIKTLANWFWSHWTLTVLVLSGWLPCSICTRLVLVTSAFETPVNSGCKICRSLEHSSIPNNDECKTCRAPCRLIYIHCRSDELQWWVQALHMAIQMHKPCEEFGPIAVVTSLLQWMEFVAGIERGRTCVRHLFHTCCSRNFDIVE